MAELIEYPFDIDYRTISRDIAKHGADFIKKHIIDNGWSETIANVIIKQALKRGWGS